MRTLVERAMMIKCRELISFTNDLLKDLEDIEVREIYYSGLRTNVDALVDLYNEEMLEYSFKVEVLKHRKHFLKFMLSKLREAEAYFKDEPNSVQKEVLEWLRSVKVGGVL